MIILKRVCILLLLLSIPILGATFRVGKTGGQFTTVQAAINQAGQGDIVEIIDFAVYAEQVTIDSTKNGLTLRSSNPANPRKPVIRYQDKINIHPINAQEALDSSKINFDQNGALRVLGASNILIEGIAVDGGGHYTFCWQAVWEAKFDLFHGNAAICLWLAGYVTIRNCDIRNAHYGIAVKNRNEGGIFANANPADIQPWKVVPLSRYGQTGGHLIEQSRIHDNVFGVFNESDWDMGSTIRYNLIYENHYSGDEAATASKLFTEGANNPGGAFLFKDNTLTPWAIYNNTLWHNFSHSIGHWQAGPQHLIFNNIFGELHDGKGQKYWNNTAYYKNAAEVQSMDKAFANRMKHCVYDCMKEEPHMAQQIVQDGQYDTVLHTYIEVKCTVDVVTYMVIQNQMDVERSDLVVKIVIPLSYDTIIKYKTITSGAVVPGATIKPFPAAAKVGYYPVRFKSTDTASSDFLVPEWDDTVVQRLILDKGWPDAGICDADGTPADLGAISKGGIPVDNAAIISLSPVMIKGQEALISFHLKEFGTFKNPEIAYFKFIKSIKFNEDSWGGNVAPVPAASILPVTINSGTPLQVGQNLLKVTPIPTPTATDPYALYEMFIKGTGSQGKTVVSSAGFHPFRFLNYYFGVWVMDIAKTDTLDTVYAGDTVLLCMQAYNNDGSKFTNTITKATVGLNSGFYLYDKQFAVISGSNLPGGIPGGYREVEVIFARVPKPDGYEYVRANGLWQDGTQQLVFAGTSDKIKILPGPADSVVFQDPVSRTKTTVPAIIDPGIEYPGWLQVYDKFGNDIDESVPVALSVKDNNPNGIIIGSNPISTNTTGRGDFTISVKGKQNDSITFIGSVSKVSGGKDYDSADVMVGKPSNQLWVFYTGAGEVIPVYDSLKRLQGYVSERLKTTIAVIKDSNNTPFVVPLNEKVTVKPMGNDPLKFYASPMGAEQSEFTLVNGLVDVWVTSLVPNQFTGPGYGMTVAPTNSASLIATTERSTRYRLYFIKNIPDFLRAAFYDMNGDGFVDRANITYNDTLSGLPDTIVLYWPEKLAANQKVITDTSVMALSPDKRTITVSITPPFSAIPTAGNGKGQTWHRVYPGGPCEPVPEFSVLDSVGPRLLGGYLYERFAAGNDTLVLDVSERINAPLITGAAGPSFTLIKKDGRRIDLTILGTAGAGNLSTITIAITDLGADAPVAGDSIKIYAKGPVVDVPGNKAHEDNPPVPLQLDKKPAPLWVFYDDIGSYDPAIKLQTSIYSRLKVTLGVTTDGSAIITKFNEKVVVKPVNNNPLTFYASATAQTAQTEFMLVNGKVDVWTTSTIPNPAGDTSGYGITAKAADSASMIITIDKSTRYKLFFVKTGNAVSRAAYYDANGDGFVDSVQISYVDTLNDRPDSLMLYWPGKAGERKKYAKNYPGILLSADKKTLSVSIAPAFTAVQTWGNGVGKSWHTFYPNMSDTVPEFPIADSVGPRLLKATLFERFVSGQDTLVLELTEDIIAPAVTQAAGVSFVLIKQGGAEADLTIVGSAGTANASIITVAIPDLGASAPAAGDSIKIYYKGPVQDVYANYAHEKNPPVPLLLKAKPVPIDSASYWDIDANGIVELLKIQLKKKIPIGSIEAIKVTFGADVATAETNQISYATGDSLTLHVALNSVFTYPVLKNRGTGGVMNAVITYKGLTEAESAFPIDKAAPVISSAHYIPGELVSDGDRKPDRLEVVFSEIVASNADKEPFLFFNVPNQNTYQILMTSVTYSTNTASAVVDTIIGRNYPSNGDSIWINTVAGITDGFTNVQSNVKNVRVPMKVDPQPLNLVIKAVSPVSPKEYRFSSKIISQLSTSISFETGVYIRIDPQNETDEDDFLREASVVIIDPVGNIIASTNTIDEDDGILAIIRGAKDQRLHVFWSGQNRNKRFVGNGVYVVIIEVTTVDGIKTKKKISLGVADSQK